ncbi:hypothetical protein [Rhizobium yanglingense]
MNRLVEDGVLPGLDAAIEKCGALSEQEPTLGKWCPSRQAADAAPRSLYVKRKVINAADIIAWAKGQGFETTLPADHLHGTITCSPVDWMAMGSAWEDEVKIPRGGPRLMERFEELFASNMSWITPSKAAYHHPLRR